MGIERSTDLQEINLIEIKDPLFNTTTLIVKCVKNEIKNEKDQK